MVGINIFISSLCGEEDESFLIIRRAIANELIKTDFIGHVYRFEDQNSTSSGLHEEIISALRNSNVVLFLIDNRNKVSDGVLREWRYSEKINKKRLIIFYNSKNEYKTDLQKECEQKNIRYQSIKCITEFIEVGYKAIINDIISVYNNITNDVYLEKEVEKYRTTTPVEYIIDTKSSTDLDFIEIKHKLKYKEVLINEVGNFINYPLNNLNENKNNDEYEELMRNLFLVTTCSKKMEDINITELECFLREIHSEQISSLIINRWNAINEYFKGNINDTFEILKKIYDDLNENVVPAWLIQDILIDLMNIEAEYYLLKNEYIVKSEYREALNKSNHFLVYPVGDRLSNDIYKKLVNEYQSKAFESPNTFNIGTGIVAPIQNYIDALTISIIYGSLTHYKLSVNLLKDIVVNYLINQKIGRFKMPAIKLALISKDFKLFEKMCSKNQGMLNVATDFELRDVFDVAIFNNQNEFEFSLIIMTYLGYYFSEETFKEYYAKINSSIFKWFYNFKREVKYGDLIFNMYKGIVFRIKIYELINIVKLTYEQGIFRFLEDALDILYYANYKNLDEGFENEFSSLLILLNNNINKLEMKDKIINFTVYFINKFPRIGEILETQITKWSHLDISKIFLVNKKGQLSSIIEESIINFNERLENQGKNGKYHGYFYSPANDLYRVVDDYKNDQWNIKLLETLVDVISKFILNRNQSIDEKIETIHFLMKLHSKFSWGKKKNVVIQGIKNILIQKEEVEFSKENFLSNTSIKDIKFNLHLLEVIICTKEYEKKLLETYKYFFINDFSDIKIIEALLVFIDCYSGNLKDEIVDNLIHIVLSFINHQEIEVRLKVIELLINFNSKKHQEIVESLIIEMFDKDDISLKIKVLRSSNKLSLECKNILYNKERLNNNYVVKEYLKEIDNA